MKIEFTNPTEITLEPAQTKTISEINVQRMIDNPKKKTVFAHTNELGIILLWKDADYDAIGQWTDTDVINKLKQLYPY